MLAWAAQQHSEQTSKILPRLLLTCIGSYRHAQLVSAKSKLQRFYRLRKDSRFLKGASLFTVSVAVLSSLLVLVACVSRMLHGPVLPRMECAYLDFAGLALTGIDTFDLSEAIRYPMQRETTLKSRIARLNVKACAEGIKPQTTNKQKAQVATKR